MSEYPCFIGFTKFFNQYYKSNNQSIQNSKLALSLCKDLCSSIIGCTGINYDISKKQCAIIKDDIFTNNNIIIKNNALFYMKSLNNCSETNSLECPYYLMSLAFIGILLPVLFIAYYKCNFVSNNRQQINYETPLINDERTVSPPPPPYDINNSDSQDNSNANNCINSNNRRYRSLSIEV